jgi:hypothetical protein
MWSQIQRGATIEHDEAGDRQARVSSSACENDGGGKMHSFSMPYSFRNGDGNVVHFGPGDHLRAWRSIPGPAHELLAAYSDRCFHSPGQGDGFREDSLEVALEGVRVLQVITPAETLGEAQRRINRGLQIVGQPWNLWFANCQDCLSWIVTGNASSFQREAAVGAAIGLAFLGFLAAVTKTPKTRSW